MKNKIKLTGIIALFTVIVFGFTTCGNGENTFTTYTVIFESNGADEVPSQEVASGSKVNKPYDPVKAFNGTLTAGLYKGLPSFYIFSGWYNGVDPWNFNDPITGDLTLTANWVHPSPIDVSDYQGENEVAKAIAFVKTNPDEYTLLIDADINLSPQTLNVSNLKLTIAGIGEERKISLSANGILFTVGGYNATDTSLTLGDKITLVGRSASGNGGEDNNNSLVSIYNDMAFIMLEGSKITGHASNSSSAVGVGGTFTMKGGIITGNAKYTTTNPTAGGVSVSSGSFIMEGGSISDNTGGDVVTGTALLILNGNAAIGEINITASYAYDPTPITISSGWTGKVTILNLTGLSTDISDCIGYFENQTILQASDDYQLSPTDVAKITSLGNFLTYGVNRSQPISDTHKIGDTLGVNIGKLVPNY